MNMLIIRTVAPVQLYIMTLFAMYLFLRGHNAPGGGFIAAVLTVAAVVLQAVAFNVRHVDALLPIDPPGFIVMGLLLAAGTGLAPAFFGNAFLDQTFMHLELPFFGDVELMTALLFDLGVYFVVIGAGKMIILTIADENSKPNATSGEQPAGRRGT